MRARLSQVHWGLVLKTAVLLYILIFILGLGLSLLMLALYNWGHVDSPIAFQAYVWISALLVLVMIGYGTSRVARKIKSAAPLHGLLIGLVLALISLLLDLIFRSEINMLGLLQYVLMVAAGWVGGVLGSRNRAQS